MDRSIISLLVLAALGNVAVGCSHTGQLREAAAADLNCPKNRVHLRSGSRDKREVEACGQLAIYRYEDGDWRMIARGVQGGPTVTGAGQPIPPGTTPPPLVTSQPAPVNQTPTGTPSQPPGTPSQPPPNMPPPAPGANQKNI
jgi:hypothetical protein